MIGTQVQVRGYRDSVRLTILLWLCILLSGGILGLVMLWYKRARLWFKQPCDVSCATVVSVHTLTKNDLHIAEVFRQGDLRFFNYRCGRYFYDGVEFVPAPTHLTVSHEKIVATKTGLTSAEATELMRKYGPNVIDIPLAPMSDEIVTSLLNPVNVYQYLCCLLWIIHDYAVFATLLGLSIIGSGIYDIYIRRTNRKKIREAAAHEIEVEVNRDGLWQKISSAELVPGDFIRLPHSKFVLPCDAVLVSGNAIVDESLLTGETMPAVKTPPVASSPSTTAAPVQTQYDPKSDRRNTVFCGTELLGSTAQVLHQTSTPAGTPVPSPSQTPEKPTPGRKTIRAPPPTPTSPSSFTTLSTASPSSPSSSPFTAPSPCYSTALVTAVGFNTMKGSFFRDIVFVKPMKYNYEREAKIFLAIMGGIAVLLFSYVMYMFYGPNGSRKSEGNHGVLYALEIITILVPAELPLVFQLGLLTSEVILQQSKISTADSSRIPLCGSVDVMCFDKTGTITQPDLEVIGVVPALRFTDGSLKFGEISRIGANIPNSLFRGLAVCHELNEVSEYVELQMSDYSDSPSKGVWSGPVLDQKLFAATGLTLQNAPTVADFNYVIGRGIDEDYGKTTGRMEILRRFEFDHGLQRMSVIVRDPLTKKFYVFMKGSPEAVAPCCNQRDGVPRTWKKDTNKYSKRGSYVIGYAFRECTEMDLDNFTVLTRTQIEKNLSFIGLALLHNQLKPDATPTITALKQGNIPSIIITGDNVYTAVHVARQSGIVSPTTDIFIGDVSVAPKSSGKADTKLINLEGDSFKQNVTFRHFDHDHCTLDTATGKLVSDKGSNLDFLSEGNGNSEKSGMMSQVSIRPDGYYLNTDNVVYALTAPAFEEIQSRGAAGISFLNEKVVVYARMKPIQKEMVINMLKENKKIVGMCGDGSNDCAALSAAHIGVALSKSEASVAVSPFSAANDSDSTSVGVVKQILCEGRAALTNSFAAFKFIVMYSVIQTIQVLIAYSFRSDLSSGEYILSDFLLCLPISFWVVRGLALDKLHTTKPTANVFGKKTISSMLSMLFLSAIALVVSVAMYYQYYSTVLRVFSISPTIAPPANLLLSSDINSPNNDDDGTDETNPRTPETTILFFTGSLLYLGIGLVVSQGESWRKPVYKHVGLIITTLCVLFSVLFLMFMPVSWDFLGFWRWCDFVELGFGMKVVIVLASVIAVIGMILVERLLYCLEQYKVL